MSSFFSTITLLNPQGMIALKERNLMIVVVLLMLIVAIPMLIVLFTFAWKYRAGTTNARSTISEQDRTSKGYIMLLWWLIPGAIIFILSIINWKSTHDLDPYKPIVSDVPPITIQVVALDWKWLFIYPQQGIATVNFLEVPLNTPVNFELTADGPMNSFWIPKLGSQMYAMPGMTTQLHLIANTTGDFSGSAAEINGAGFSGMRFITRSVSQVDFDQWVASVKSASSSVSESVSNLTFDEYQKLAEPSENNPVTLYSSVDENLYNDVMAKFKSGNRLHYRSTI